MTGVGVGVAGSVVGVAGTSVGVGVAGTGVAVAGTGVGVAGVSVGVAGTEVGVVGTGVGVSFLPMSGTPVVGVGEVFVSAGARVSVPRPLLFALPQAQRAIETKRTREIKRLCFIFTSKPSFFETTHEKSVQAFFGSHKNAYIIISAKK